MVVSVVVVVGVQWLLGCWCCCQCDWDRISNDANKLQGVRQVGCGTC